MAQTLPRQTQTLTCAGWYKRGMLPWRRLGRVGPWVIAVAATVLAFAPWGDASFDRFHLPKELALCLCAAAAVWSVSRLDRLDLALLAWLAAFTVSCAAAVNPWLAGRQWAIAAGGVALFAGARALSRDEARLMVTLVLGLIGLGAVLGLLEGYGALHLARPGYAPGATLGQRNTLAHLLALAAPWFLARASGEPWRRAAGWGTGLALVAAVIVLTRSRAAYLALPLGLAIGVVLSGRPTLRTAAALALGAAGVAAMGLTRSALDWKVAHPYLDTLARLFDGSHGSGLGRLVQARASVSLWLAHPVLGVGPGNWAVEYPTVTPPHDPTFFGDLWSPTGRLVNSDWVAVLVEQGTVGLVCLLVAGGATVVTLWRSPGPWRASALASLGAGVVLCSFDAVLQLAPAVALLAGLMGVAMPRSEADARFPVPRWATVAVLCVLLLAAGRGALQLQALHRLAHPEWGLESLELAAGRDPGSLAAHSTLADVYLGRGDCDGARPHLQALARLYPRHARIRQALAGCSHR